MFCLVWDTGYLCTGLNGVGGAAAAFAACLEEVSWGKAAFGEASSKEEAAVVFPSVGLAMFLTSCKRVWRSLPLMFGIHHFPTHLIFPPH